ncbi:MAG: class I SAM-dependent methyltransferase [Burkholderiales bacterium]|nr:class I SAM-dependent methyltransferase [Burkholderiales bacterium]
MSTSTSDTAFTGSVPELYEQYLVPMIFEPYAADIAERLVPRKPQWVLEIAAGTGVVTRRLAKSLGPEACIIATDLNQAMLDKAAAIGTSRPVEWRQADAMQLPFPDHTFDAVVCQFGVMFFQDKQKAFAQAKRVLREGGVFILNVWDSIEHNEFADTVSRSLESVFSDDPPKFISRTPHGYYDLQKIAEDLARGGFDKKPEMTTVGIQTRAASARIPAMAFCQGTPLRGEIEARDASRLSEATDVAVAALAKRFGSGAIQGKIQAHVIVVER